MNEPPASSGNRSNAPESRRRRRSASDVKKERLRVYDPFELIRWLALPTGRSDEGIPEPELVDQPGARWRSRIVDGRWQVNAGHPEYREIADQVAAYADRKLAQRRPRKR